MMILRKKSLHSITIIFLAIISIGYSSFLALVYGHQPPLDDYSFRQTQTALTAYWFIQDGFKLAYETPVAGAPWSIPFEFPIYQFLVAVTSKLFGSSLDFTGRIISYLFMILCLVPVKSITKNLRLPDNVFYIFSAILFTTPLYVYWGRTFMIETTALFFSIAAIKYFIEIITKGFSLRCFLFYIFFISLSILQKSTTGLPVLLILSIAFILTELKISSSIKDFIFSKRLFFIFIYFVIPLAIGMAWLVYTDQVKSLNSLGTQLTSNALSKWNWGSIQQKLSADLYINVIWNRIFVKNLAGMLGASILVLSFFSKPNTKAKYIVIYSCALGLVPFFLFTNLHIVHDYYQCANLIFLIYAIAVAIGGIFAPALGDQILIPTLTLFFISNYITLSSGYLLVIKTKYTKENRDLAIGEILKRELSKDKQFIAFGNDWSSSLAYISQRKSFTVPMFYKNYAGIVNHPENFIDNNRLGAIVVCPTNSPNIDQLIYWSTDNRLWKIAETNTCYILTPQKPINLYNPTQVTCKGNIDQVAVEDRDGIKIILFTGWTTMSDPKVIIPDNVFIALSRPGVETIYLETLKVPRLDVNTSLGIPMEVDTGFSRIIAANLPFDEYNVSIIQTKGKRQEICQFHKQLILSGLSRSINIK
jgi:hypothetical protein